jgi:hypothetical protein
LVVTKQTPVGGSGAALKARDMANCNVGRFALRGSFVSMEDGMMEQKNGSNLVN